MRNRVAQTSTTVQLISTVASRRHHVGRRIDAVRNRDQLPLAAIPQQLDVDLYHKYFDGMLGGYEWTGRLYASLCIVRNSSLASSWPAAAARLGVDPALGLRTARAANHRMRCPPSQFAVKVRQAQAELPTDRDFRALEGRVEALAQGPEGWFALWCKSVVPARRQAVLPYAISWMWCEVAQGLLDNSPAVCKSRRANAAYRSFRDSLPYPAQRALRQLVLE
jgi:hypothetical protein